MFGVSIFGERPFGSFSLYDSVVTSPPSPTIVVAVAAALRTRAASTLVTTAVLANNRTKVTPTLSKTAFT